MTVGYSSMVQVSFWWKAPAVAAQMRLDWSDPGQEVRERIWLVEVEGIFRCRDMVRTISQRSA